MLAVTFSDFGGPESIRVVEKPEPQPAEGEVLVRVAAATINPTDLLMLGGKQVALMQGLTPPFTAGMEFAGQVLSTSGNEAAGAVMGIVNPRRALGGAHARVISVPQVSLMPVPEGMDLAEAATLPMNGVTSLMALDLLALGAGATLLVTGAAGSVGGYVIEIASDAGLKVIADASPADAELVRGLGATHVVSRGAAMASEVRAISPDGVDGLVDAALLGEAAAALVRDGGAAVALRRSNPFKEGRIRAEYVSILNGAQDAALLARFRALTARRVLTPRVAARVPVERAAEAFAMVERGGLRGRVVLEFADK